MSDNLKENKSDYSALIKQWGELQSSIDSLVREMDYLRDDIDELDSYSPPHSLDPNRKLLDFLFDHNYFNWVKAGTSSDHTRSKLGYVMCKGDFIYSTNGRIILQAPKPLILEDGYYATEGEKVGIEGYPDLLSMISCEYNEVEWKLKSHSSDLVKILIEDDLEITFGKDLFTLCIAYHGMSFKLYRKQAAHKQNTYQFKLEFQDGCQATIMSRRS